MSELVYATIGSSAADGPLIGGLSVAEATYLAAINPAALGNYINEDMRQAEENLPEGTRVELQITGWTVFYGSAADAVASQIQAAFAAGKVIDSSTGQPPATWPEYPYTLAEGDDATDTVILRWVKEGPELVVVLVAIIIILAVVIYLLMHAGWQAQSATPQGGAPPAEPPGLSFLEFLAKNWPLLLIGGLALASAPFVIHELAKTREAEVELAAAGKGEE
jgi:hypothetical protein